MASYRIVYACPDCQGTDLEEDEHGLWCPGCETLFSFTQFPPDYQHPEEPEEIPSCCGHYADCWCGADGEDWRDDGV